MYALYTPAALPNDIQYFETELPDHTARGPHMEPLRPRNFADESTCDVMRARTCVCVYKMMTGSNSVRDLYRFSVASASWTQCGAWEVFFIALAIAIQLEPRNS
jgi:hypothetical protein